MGRLKSDQGQLFYEFDLSDAVPEDHMVRKIAAALDLSWLRGELGPVDKRDSQISVSMIQDCLSRGGRIGARRSEQCGMGDNFPFATA